MNHAVLLATRSPLYAPVFHAWATADDEFRKRLHLSYATDTGKSDEDDLMDGALRAHDKRNVLMAIGDLTRLHGYWRNPDNFRAPVILHGLIDKMCLWLLDGSSFFGAAQDDDDPETGPLILCHPRHMTTYHVAYYHALTNALWDEEKIKQRLCPVIRPGMELRYYETWKAKRKNKHRLAYMSSDIPSHDATVAVGFANHYGDISMTGIFTSEPKWKTEKGLIEEFCGRIRSSIALMYTEHDQLAWDLSRKQDLLAPLGFNRSYGELSDITAFLREIDGYSTDLSLKECQLKAMTDIRDKVDGIDGALLLENLKQIAVCDFKDEVHPERRPDFEKSVVDDRAALRLAEVSKDTVEISKSQLAFVAIRSAYTALAMLAASKEVSITVLDNKALSWSTLEFVLIFGLFCFIVLIELPKMARNIRAFSGLSMLAVLFSLYGLFVPIVHNIYAPYLQEAAMSLPVALAGTAGLWIKATRWKPDFSIVTGWVGRLKTYWQVRRALGETLRRLKNGNPA